MISKSFSCIFIGSEATLVEVEVDIQPGLPSINIVGLADTAVKEAKERIKSALIHSDFQYPKKRITVNLFPADIKKTGSIFDLPIAIAILKASQQINYDWINKSIILGELSLNGLVRKAQGTIIASSLAKKESFEYCIIPFENKEEAALVNNINIIPAISLAKLLNPSENIKEKIFQLNSNTLPKNPFSLTDNSSNLDFNDVKGQFQVKRAIEVACAGYHNIIMIGSPGCGKTMLAQRIPSILPPLTKDEIIETLKIYSLSNQEMTSRKDLIQRPFRSPHHTASHIAIIGGGAIPKPGEISFAHKGVLFLDELPEFKREVREALREPIEQEEIIISRHELTINYPAHFLLVATMNPCFCGYFTHQSVQCRCSEKQRKSYVNKISGPLLDRIDIRVHVMDLDYEDIFDNAKEEFSRNIRKKIIKAWEIQRERFENNDIIFNSQMPYHLSQKYCILNNSLKKIIKDGMQKFNLSPRSLNQILQTSRTIADLEGKENIEDKDIYEAFYYRSADKTIFL